MSCSEEPPLLIRGCVLVRHTDQTVAGGSPNAEVKANPPLAAPHPPIDSAVTSTILVSFAAVGCSVHGVARGSGTATA